MERIMQERVKQLSVIIPVYNEEENVPLLHEQISRALQELDLSYEVIYVDDGSKDGTFAQLKMLALQDAAVQVVQLRRNFGQTAAMAAGVDHSSGEVLVFMDGDLQNDPEDIQHLLAKLDQGYDVVSGWRKNRQDASVSRKLPSMIANRLIANVTGVHLHDYGCTLKAYRWEVFKHMRLYGEMHRFLPAYAAMNGASIAELEVAHHPRRFGVSKYGISRTLRVVADLITIKYLASYRTKPMHAFGIPGIFLTLLGSGWFATRLLQGVARRKAPNISSPLHVVGFGLQLIATGATAEVLMRTYYESQGKPVYVVKTAITQSPSALSLYSKNGAQQTPSLQ